MLKFIYLFIYFLLNNHTNIFGQNISLFSNDSLSFQSFDNSTLILNPKQSKLLDGHYNVYSEFDSTKLLYCFNVKDKTIVGTILKYMPPTGKLREVIIYENKKIVFYMKLFDCEIEYVIFGDVSD